MKSEIHSSELNISRLTGSAIYEKWKYPIALAAILLISFISYLPVLHNNFINWDDPEYIKNNPLVTAFDLKGIFSTFILGNYHPFTILVYSLEYHLFGLNPAGYHAVNLLFHLGNIILVFYAVFLLSDKMTTALIASLLFGIHPLHVESIAWAAELKDVLYCMFFLSSYIFYLKYINGSQRRYYWYAILFFLASLLSKAMAVSLPLVFLLTDYFKGRKIDKKNLLEKAPFFLLSIIFGLIAIKAQKSFGYTELETVLTFPQRMVFAVYSFVNYLVKLVLPLDLSVFYAYPENESGIFIPGYFFLYVLSFMAVVIYLAYTQRFTRKVIFGLGFFTLTILMVLQLLPVGKAMMAERYSYIPSIGIFYLAGEGFVLLLAKKQKITAFLLLGLVTVFFSVKTYARCGDWKDDMTIWNKVIGRDLAEGKDPLSKDEGKDKEAEIGLVHEPANTVEYVERGTYFARAGKNEEALNDYNKAIELNPKNDNAYLKRGIVFFNLKRNDEAISDFTKAIGLKSDYLEAYNNRGIVLFNLKRYEEAIDDFDKAIEIKPDYALAYHNKGNVFFEEKRYDEAVKNFSRAIELKNDFAPAYYKRGLALSYMGKDEAACTDLEKALDLGYIPAADAISRTCRTIILHRNEKARAGNGGIEAK